MNRDLDAYEKFQKDLENRFPKMFSERYGGIEIGPGWWPIIESLCVQIQGRIDLRDRQLESKTGEKIPQVVVQQIKEKFGGLRFYYNGGDDYIDGLTQMAESISYKICETCGKPGQPRNNRWIKTLCDEHHVEREEYYKNMLSK